MQCNTTFCDMTVNLTIYTYIFIYFFFADIIPLSFISSTLYSSWDKLLYHVFIEYKFLNKCNRHIFVHSVIDIFRIIKKKFFLHLYLFFLVYSFLWTYLDLCHHHYHRKNTYFLNFLQSQCLHNQSFILALFTNESDSEYVKYLLLEIYPL